MSTVYVSCQAYTELCQYIKCAGYNVAAVSENPQLEKAVSSHPDLIMCKMGALPNSPIVFSDSVLCGGYPGHAAFCAAVIGKYLIHRLDITSPRILSEAAKIGLNLVNVRQGYAKCSCVVVDSCSIITSDRGIAAALSVYNDVHVLLVSPGYVELPGYKYGFIGGASGRIGSEVIFNGSLESHPDCDAIRAFISSRNLKLKDFPGLPLRDIGSIIQAADPIQGAQSEAVSIEYI